MRIRTTHNVPMLRGGEACCKRIFRSERTSSARFWPRRPRRLICSEFGTSEPKCDASRTAVTEPTPQVPPPKPSPVPMWHPPQLKQVQAYAVPRHLVPPSKTKNRPRTTKPHRCFRCAVLPYEFQFLSQGSPRNLDYPRSLVHGVSRL